MEPKHLSPRATYCPITGPSPHMRQLLDSGTWHQQQLIQATAGSLSHTPHTVVYFTAGINSFLHRILERIKNFTILKSYI
jgi:deoxyadenosine/deoxycytidine kinase